MTSINSMAGLSSTYWQDIQKATLSNSQSQLMGALPESQNNLFSSDLMNQMAESKVMTPQVVSNYYDKMIQEEETQTSSVNNDTDKLVQENSNLGNTIDALF